MSMRRPNKIWLMLSRNTGCVIDEILSVFPVCSLVFIGCTGAKFLNDRLKTPLYARLFGYFSFVDYCCYMLSLVVGVFSLVGNAIVIWESRLPMWAFGGEDTANRADLRPGPPTVLLRSSGHFVEVKDLTFSEQPCR